MGLRECECTVTALLERPLCRAKAIAIAELAQKGVLVPPTLLLNGEVDIKHIKKIANQWDAEKCYARICHSDVEYPHYDYVVASKNQLATELEELFRRKRAEHENDVDIIIQPLLPIRQSAVVVMQEGTILVEEVDGAPRVLLREGYFQRRTLYKANGKRVWQMGGHQPYAMHLTKNEGLVRVKTARVEVDISALFITLGQLEREGVSVFEVGWSGDIMLFLDSRSLPNKAYRGIEAALDDGWLVIYPGKDDSWREAVTVPWANFDCINLLERAPAVEIRGGAAASHLCANAAERRVACRLAIDRKLK